MRASLAERLSADRCKCHRHPVWLALDALVWLTLDRGVLISRRCPMHGACR